MNPMRRPQFTLKTLLWLMAAIMTIFAGWTMIDVAGEATRAGEVPYGKLAWMGAAYSIALLALAHTRG